jgi:MoaA/NifB/PqqE/SkfB family radical SAM enzyme
MHSITTRIDRLAALASETRSPTPPVPKSVKIELTGRCDFQCFFCASHTRPREKSDMPWEVYTRRVRELRELGVEQLGMFYLGESFLCDWLSEAIRYAKRECGYPYVFLTTNGRLATAARVRECMLAGLDSLKFAVNCCGPAQLHAVARVEPGEFHVIVRNIRDARRVRDEIKHETGHRCGLYASSLLYDESQRSRMNPVLLDILPYVDEHYWLPLFGYPGTAATATASRLAPAAADRAEIKLKPLPCWPLFKEGHITWDGRLSACCLDHAARFHMGNLGETPFLEAWHSPAFQQLREAHLRQDVRGFACENCIAYR